MFGVLGYGVYIMTKFAYPPMLCKLSYHERSFLRGSDTSACPGALMEPIGVLCQALEAHKNLEERRIRI